MFKHLPPVNEKFIVISDMLFCTSCRHNMGLGKPSGVNVFLRYLGDDNNCNDNDDNNDDVNDANA